MRGCWVVAALLAVCTTAGCGGEDAPDSDLRKRAAPSLPASEGIGVNFGYQPAGDASPATSLRAMQALGLRFERTGLSWRALPTRPDVPVHPDMRTPLGRAPAGSGVANLDRHYLDLVRRGITPIFILGDVPRWASTLRDCADPALARPDRCPPGWHSGLHLPGKRFYAQWREWVGAVARRYPQAAIEGPNEPDLAWTEHRRDARRYPMAVEPEEAARIQCELFRAVRAVDRRTVLSMGMGTPAYERRFVKAAGGCYDAFSFHFYPQDIVFGGDSDLDRALATLDRARQDAGDETPVWVTETGFTFVPRQGAARHNAHWEGRFARGIVALRKRLAREPDVDVVIFHTLRDAPLEIHSDPAGPEYHYGLFRRDWTPKPRACALLRERRASWPGC